MGTNDPSALLMRLVKEPNENEWLEFKLNNEDPQEIGEYVSALANSAMLADRDRAFLVFGVENETRKLIGTTIRLSKKKKGNEGFHNWLNRLLDPQILLELIDFSFDGKQFSIIVIEPTYDRPVRFSGTEYIRLGEHKRKLSDLVEHERALWIATGRRKFEAAIAMTNQTVPQVLSLLDTQTYYVLTGEPPPRNDLEIVRRLEQIGAIKDNMEDRFDITNLGAILLASDISRFPSM